MPLDPDGSSSLERERNRRGVQKLRRPRGEIPVSKEENDAFREKTVSPGILAQRRSFSQSKKPGLPARNLWNSRILNYSQRFLWLRGKLRITDFLIWKSSLEIYLPCQLLATLSSIHPPNAHYCFFRGQPNTGQWRGETDKPLPSRSAQTNAPISKVVEISNLGKIRPREKNEFKNPAVPPRPAS